MSQMLARLDAKLAAAEERIAAALLGAALCCLLAGAVMRSLGRPLIWGDELAVLAMVIAAFFAGSAAIARGAHLTVDGVLRHLPRWARRGVDLVLVALLLGFFYCLWVWLDPVGLIAAGSGAQLARDAGNFTYTEPTMTLGVLKIWFWLPMLPAALGALFHALVRVLRC
ncbi:TRAP transporter small permease [Citreicella sp. C3M06]|uniref:TRAP transporter small permease n=1 Tax=Roseobacteraceae TaxID=2854170 RepID=UPI001C081285|nr:MULTISPECIES: TRAP transporter small permease subunit [Roseobacteraceae]MBU2963586.1 TRAP transporter small permease [Citreicella sp. C3M06]MDO6587895.1 TRAP transporter small permease subunit [Salipiger sp. 1_MG-2023]